MSDAADVIYWYDGSFEGFLCCVFESVYARQTPVQIAPESEAQPTFFDETYIETDPAKAERVYASIAQKINPQAEMLVRDVFFSCMPQKELALLRFLQLGYKTGPGVMQMLGHPVVQPLLAAQQSLHHEAHLLLGFIRFAQHGPVLIGHIRPKNFVLPYLQAHFCGRLYQETFLIFDQTHRAALVWQNKQARILPLDALELPPADAQEQAFQALWQRFYNTVSIPARENARARMTHCPQRYWSTMCEMPPPHTANTGPQCASFQQGSQTHRIQY